MSSDLALSIRGLGKSYRIRHADGQPGTLAEAALSRLRRPRAARRSEEFWALHGVDLDVRRGEILGIIGPNGAGKSTLLKVLSRITYPTIGRVELFGRIGSLLEVGTGFHPELTGRENIFLNGTILGMRRREVARRFDEIVDFAGVETFLDTPVKRYSSGMYVRLAFAVAAHLDTEILLVDEVLAVGDAAFQRKSVGKMGEAAGAGRTVVLVSHNLAVMASVAQSCALLDQGVLVAHTTVDDAIRRYAERLRIGSDGVAFSDESRQGTFDVVPSLRLETGRLHNQSAILAADSSIGCDVGWKVLRDVRRPQLRVTICRVTGEAVGSSFTDDLPSMTAGESFVCALEISGMYLTQGSYTMTLSMGEADAHIGHVAHDRVVGVMPFEVGPRVADGVPSMWYPQWGSEHWPPPKVRVVSRLGT